MTSVLLISNPAAGRRRAARDVPTWQTGLERAGAHVELVTTTHRGHARQLASEAKARGFDAVLSYGGDGTLAEVVNGLMGEAGCKLPIGYLPGGTANVLTLHYGRRTMEQTIAALVAGETRAVDLAEVRTARGTHFAMNIVVAGFMVKGTAASEAIRPWARGLGSARYKLGGLWGVITSSLAERMQVRFDGEQLEGEFAGICLLNTPYVGRGLTLAPGADPEDGAWDLIIARRMSHLRLLTTWPRLGSMERLEAHPDLEYRQVKSLEIEAIRCEDEGLNVDGELEHSLPVSVRIRPGALRVIL